MDNFRQHVCSKIDFQDGVTAIVGPNGSGKTTILEAIAWALYGTAAIRENKSTVRSLSSEGGAKVTVCLTFELSGQRYTVRRRMDPSGNSVASLEHNGIVVRKGQTDVSDALGRMLGMDHKAFFNSFFTAQKDLDFMSSMDGSTRAAAISKMLGYERLSKARDKIIVERRGMDQKIDALSQALGDLQQIEERLKLARERQNQAEKDLKEASVQLSAREKQFSELGPVLQDWQKKQEQNLQLKSEIRDLELRLSHAQETKEKASVKLSEIQSIKKELEDIKPQIEDIEEKRQEFKKINQNRGFGDRRNEILTTTSVYRDNITKLESTASDIKNAEASYKKSHLDVITSENSISDLEKTCKALSEDRIARVNSAKAHADNYKTRISQLVSKKKEIADTGEEGKCPTCERPLAGELSVVLAGFDSQINALRESLTLVQRDIAELESPNTELINNQQQLDSLKKNLPNLRKAASAQENLYNQAKKALENIGEMHAKIAVLETELSGLPEFDQERCDFLLEYAEKARPMLKRYDQLQNLLNSEQEHRQEHENALEFIKVLSTGRDKAGSDLKELGFDQQQFDKVASDYKSAQEELTQSKIACERCKSESSAAQDILKNAESDWERYKAQSTLLEETRKSRLYLHTLHTTLDAFRNELNSRIRPELELNASEILAAITEGRYSVLDIDEDYKAYVVDDGEKKLVISGGEEDVVNLALRLAVSQMIVERAGQDLSLLIMDEVFGSLDGGRRDSLVALLQNLKSRFEQIIIITHIDSIHDSVDNTIWVKFDEQTKTSSISNQQEAAAFDPAMLQLS